MIVGQSVCNWRNQNRFANSHVALFNKHNDIWSIFGTFILAY